MFIAKPEIKGLQSLSESLLSDYFALEDNGFRVAPCICLFGAELPLLHRLADCMRAQLRRQRRWHPTIAVSHRPVEGTHGMYAIDAGYFLPSQSPVRAATDFQSELQSLAS